MSGHCCCCEDHRVRRAVKAGLPSTPGSVIQSRNGNRRVLIDGRWRLVAGASVVKWFNLNDDRLEDNDYKPIFDAGAK